MMTINEKAKVVRECLDHAVAKALDKKRRLGQYAVVRENGKIMYLDWSKDPNGQLLDKRP